MLSFGKKKKNQLGPDLLEANLILTASQIETSKLLTPHYLKESFDLSLFPSLVILLLRKSVANKYELIIFKNILRLNYFYATFMTWFILIFRLMFKCFFSIPNRRKIVPDT